MRHVVHVMQALFNVGVFFFLRRHLYGFWVFQDLSGNARNVTV